MANDSWSGQDKAQHFIASAMLSAAGNELPLSHAVYRPLAAISSRLLSPAGAVNTLRT